MEKSITNPKTPKDTKDISVNIKNVTDRDLASVKQHNPQLFSQLKKAFEQNKKKSDEEIKAQFVDLIEKYLKLK